MSQRRGGSHKEPVVAVEEETIPFNESLDLPADGLSMERAIPEASAAPIDAPVASGSLSLDARYESETQTLKLKVWKEGHFAAGMTAASWGEEYHKWRHNFREQCFEDDGNPCGCCSSVVCGALGAGRIGNMAILRQSTEWVEEQEEDETTGEMKPKRFTRPRLDMVAGPVSGQSILCLRVRVQRHVTLLGLTFLFAF